MKPRKLPPRNKFTNTVLGILGSIHGATIKAVKFQEPDDLEDSKSKKETKEFSIELANTIMTKLLNHIQEKR